MTALLQFLALPSDNRFPLLGGSLLFWILVNLFLIYSNSRKSAWLIGLLDSIKRPGIKDIILVVATSGLFLRISLAILQALAADNTELRFVGYAEVLSPLLDLMAFVFLEIVALNMFFAIRDRVEDKKPIKAMLARILVILVLLGLTVLYISMTDMGIVPNHQWDWGRGLPAVPLLEWQIILACILCAGMVFTEANPRISSIPRLDLWIGLAVWLLAVVIWLGGPVVPNASALEPIAPNFEVYPFNDAETYDEISQSVLVGNGFGTDIPPRPLYIVLLTLMHVLIGQDYGKVIALQSMIFAFFPVLLYFLGREFFGRPIGVSIALLAILRDWTSNLVSPFTGNLSYSKLYLSEIPTAMVLILFLLVGLRWIKSGLPLFSGFLLGGILGAGMLIRSQVVIALPVLLLFAFIAHSKKIVLIVKNTLLLLIAIIIVISPWLWRNWRMTGEWTLENPVSQMSNLALRYNKLNGVDVQHMPLPGETIADYNTRTARLVAQAIDSNPLGIVRGIANSFLNHGVNNILLFPLRNALRNTGEFWIPATAFWEEWEGRPTISQGLLLAFYIFLFGLGLAAAWQRAGWLGFLPLALNLIYNLSTSMALISGQRFMVSMDWSVYLYYMVGLFALLSLLLFTLERGRSAILKWYEENRFTFTPPGDRKNTLQYAFAALLFLGIGASLPLSETIFPKKYPQASREEVRNRPEFSSALRQSSVDTACFQKIVDQTPLSIVRGRAVYPRFYDAGEGEAFTDAAGYKIVDHGRLVFQMIGQITDRIVFPMTAPPDFFPNASDVTLFMDADGNTWFLFVEQGDLQRMYYSEALVSSVCK